MTLKNLTIARIVSLLGLFIGCGMLAIAAAGTPHSGSAEAQESDASVHAQTCHIEEVTLDEGYGVGGKELRRICTEND